MLDLFAACVVITALLAYLNHRFVGLPTTIGVMAAALVSLLLFASALHVDLSELKAYRWPVAALASVGTLLSTLAVGYGMWFTLPLTGLELPLL